MTTRIKYIYRIYNTKTNEWLSHYAPWPEPKFIWLKKMRGAQKWATPKALAEFFLNWTENDEMEDFTEIPDTWEVRKTEVKTETRELTNDTEQANLFVQGQVRWPHLYKFWREDREWALKSALNSLPEDFSAKYAIMFTNNNYHNSWISPTKSPATTTTKFNVNDVRSLLIKAKKRMTGKMRVLLRYSVVFVSNEDDLTIVKMTLNEHIRFIIDMNTGLDPAGRKIVIDDYPF